MKKPSYERLRCDSEPPRFDDFDVPVEARRAFYIAMGEYINNDVHGLWLEPESHDGHCDPDVLTYTIGKQYAELANAYNGKLTQSPIEDMLLGAMLWMSVDWAGLPRYDSLEGGPSVHLKELGGSEKLEFWITTQADVAGYHVDLMAWFIWGRHVSGVAIECDGHAFHEKTKEQAARDKSRDRALLLAGYPVMRFTGSEIFADPVKCAAQVREALGQPLERVSKAAGFMP